MQVLKEHFEDVGERDDDCYYTGCLYRFVFDREIYIVRRYEDDLTSASFLSRLIKDRHKWRREQFTSVPYDSPAFREAVKYLVKTENVRWVYLLAGSYVAVNMWLGDL